MRKHLFSAHPCGGAEFFHFRPDVAAVYRVSIGSDKDTALPDFLLASIFQQCFAQLLRQKYDAALSFQRTSACPIFAASTVMN